MRDLQCDGELAHQTQSLRPQFPDGRWVYDAGLSVIPHGLALHQELREIDLSNPQFRDAILKCAKNFVLELLLTIGRE